MYSLDGVRIVKFKIKSSYKDKFVKLYAPRRCEQRLNIDTWFFMAVINGFFTRGVKIQMSTS